MDRFQETSLGFVNVTEKIVSLSRVSHGQSALGRCKRSGEILYAVQLECGNVVPRVVRGGVRLRRSLKLLDRLRISSVCCKKRARADMSLLGGKRVENPFENGNRERGLSFLDAKQCERRTGRFVVRGESERIFQRL